MAVVVQFVSVIGYFLLTRLAVVKFYQQEVFRTLSQFIQLAPPAAPASLTDPTNAAKLTRHSNAINFVTYNNTTNFTYICHAVTM
jgi:hypothetical protein